MAQPVLKDEQTSGAPARTRYEDDLYTWVQEQVELLRSGRVDALDLDNIAEELSDVGNGQYNQLESTLRVLLIHMLNWDQQPEKRMPSWIFSSREQRRRYARLLKKNPGLKASLDEAREAAYPTARDWASDECHLPVDEFPPECPYDWKDILERPFDFDSVKT
jgi:Rad3-related DNA helicase